MSFGRMLTSSMGLSPVSLLISILVFSGLFACEIRVSMFDVDGTLGSFSSGLYFGIFHSIL